MNWSPKRWALLLACVVVLAFIVVLGRSESGKAYVKTSWEYKRVDTNVLQRLPTGGEDVEGGLNQLGVDGWELVQFIRTDEMRPLSGTWIFKRPK